MEERKGEKNFGIEEMEAKPGAANPNWMLLPLTQHFPGHALEPA
jgi:hypothetical protein